MRLWRRRRQDPATYISLTEADRQRRQASEQQLTGKGRPVTGHSEAVRELVRALGIDTSTTRAVTIRLAVDEAATIEVERLVLDTHLRQATEVVQRRHIVAPPPAPLDPYQVMAGALL